MYTSSLLKTVTDVQPKSADELYNIYKQLEAQIKYHEVHARFLKEEHEYLKEQLVSISNEIKRIQSVPLVVGQFLELVDDKHAIVQGMGGISFYVRVLGTIDREKLNPSVTLAMHRQSQSIVDLLPENNDLNVRNYFVSEKPSITYADVGGLDVQKQEIREAIELPLTCADLYEQIGIDAPTGVLLYGPPGTGKTMLARAVANSANANFYTMVGSEFVQKYLGEGPRMVRDVFKTAKENAPSIIFIDEVDTIATKRFDAQTGADREVQRILMELLNQMDGFDQTDNVKVIMATNRADTLDPALLRPGRLDRKIEFPLPDRRQRRLIFQSCMNKMNISPEVDIQEFVNRPGQISAADIAAVCQAAGMNAVRFNRYIVLQTDFEKGWQTHVKNKEDLMHFYSI